MIWNNLKQDPPLCPLCGEPLEFNERSGKYICTDFMNCDFSIREDRFNDIVADLEDSQDTEFSGNCEVCGKSIDSHYRTCKNCL